MTQLAGEYYGMRAEHLHLGAVPVILQGAPHKLAGPMGRHEIDAGELAVAVAATFVSTEDFLLGAIPAVLKASGMPLNDAQWQTMQSSRRSGRTDAARPYAREKLLPALLSDFPDRGATLYMEAVAPSELPQTIRNRLLGASQKNQDTRQEPARAFLLARSHTSAGELVTAHASLILARYILGKSGSEPTRLAMRYGGTLIVNNSERNRLPPLTAG